MIDFATAYPNSRKVYDERTARLAADGSDIPLRIPLREVTLGGGEPPVRLYDTSGPQGQDVRSGLPKLRADWIAARRRSGFVGTQLYYARRGEITPEMEFVAAREGLPANRSVAVEEVEMGHPLLRVEEARLGGRAAGAGDAGCRLREIREWSKCLDSARQDRRPAWRGQGEQAVASGAIR